MKVSSYFLSSWWQVYYIFVIIGISKRSTTLALTPNDPYSESRFESLDIYHHIRRMQSNFTITKTQPEICRYLNESSCQKIDERARRLQERTALGDQKVLVLLLKIVPDRPVPPKSEFEALFGSSEVGPEPVP